MAIDRHGRGRTCRRHRHQRRLRLEIERLSISVPRGVRHRERDAIVDIGPRIGRQRRNRESDRRAGRGGDERPRRGGACVIIDGPGHCRTGQNAGFGIGSHAGRGNSLPGNEASARARRSDLRRRRRAGRHCQHGGVADHGAEIVVYHHAVRSLIVRRRGSDGQRRPGGAGNVEAVARPLIAKRTGPVGNDAERDGVADGEPCSAGLLSNGRSVGEADAIDAGVCPGVTAGEVIEVAVGINVEIDHAAAREVAGEVVHLAGGGIVNVNPIVDEISEEIVAVVLSGEIALGRIVKRAGGDGEAGVGTEAVAVSEDRPGDVRIAGGAFGLRPAVIGTGVEFVDFLPGVLADVVDEDFPGTGLHAEGERVSQAERVDGTVDPGGRAGDALEMRGVVRGNGAIGIDAEDFAAEAVEVLGRGAVDVIAGGDVELAVLAEVHRAAVVGVGTGGGGDGIEIEKDCLTRRIGGVARGSEPADAVEVRGAVVAADEIVSVEVAVTGEVRVERQADEAVLAEIERIDVDKRRRQKAAALNDATRRRSAGRRRCGRRRQGSLWSDC